MGLLSVFKRSDPPPAATTDTADAVQRARTLARQRLIGAAVLVVIGVIGFPLVFETQPRPIPVDIPIEVPRKDGAPPLVMPPARSAAPAASGNDARIASGTVPPAPAMREEPAEPAGRPADSAASTPPARAAEVEAPMPKPALAMPAEPLPKPAAPVTAPKADTGDAARAKALLEGKPVAAVAANGRFVVQVGAFADASAARDARARAEKVGLKTYTQVANTAAGDRIRVRVGPFATRDEADKALAKARGAGLAAAVLTL